MVHHLRLLSGLAGLGLVAGVLWASYHLTSPKQIAAAWLPARSDAHVLLGHSLLRFR